MFNFGREMLTRKKTQKRACHKHNPSGTKLAKRAGCYYKKVAGGYVKATKPRMGVDGTRRF